ncbi:MAG: lipopolysaccharide biosynthesis protein [Actinomycetota bacterium]|nr:lipopolysaccharide biosynthesis protein [Actinomycetota bacterium]
MTDPAIDRAELQRRAVSGSLWTAMHVLVSLPIAFVANAVVARILGVSEYGRLAFLTALLVTAGQLLNLGSSNATIQFGAAAHAQGRVNGVNVLLRKALSLQLLQAPLLIAIAVVVLQGSPSYLILAAATGIAASALLGTSSLALTVESRTGVGARIAIVSNLFVQVAVVAAAILFHNSAGVWSVRTGVVGLLLGLCLIPLAAHRRRACLLPAVPRRFPDGYWPFALSIGSATFIGTLVFSRSEIFLLQWLSTPVAVGLFALAYGIGTHLTALSGVLLGPLIPTVAGLVATDPTAVSRAYRRVLGASSVFVGFLTAVLFPPVFVLVPLIYGKQYVEVPRLLLGLGLAAFLTMLVSPTYAFVTARRRGSTLIRINAIALGVDVALAVPLILLWDAAGAVIANVAGATVASALLVSDELRSQNAGWKTVAAPLRTWLAAAVVAVAVIAISAVSPMPAISTAAAAMVVGCVGWFLSLRLVRGGLDTADLLALTAALPGRFARGFERLLRRLIPTRDNVPVTGDGAD